jgi:two-component system, NtrC family, sensor kinase
MAVENTLEFGPDVITSKFLTMDTMTSSFQDHLPSTTHVGESAMPDHIRPRVLIVDDEEMVTGMFADFLADRYWCSTASNAEMALAWLEKEEFALVILDVIMPGLSGVELLQKITERFPDTAVIIVSGVDRPQRILYTMRLGASDYLTKPCELDKLSFSIERALERRALKLDARLYKQTLERRNSELASRQAELERLQAQIVHSEKMASLGQLAAGVAHELNNPAGFIHGNMEFLEERIDGLERLFSVYRSLSLPPEVENTIAELEKVIGCEDAFDDLRSMIEDCRIGAERIRDVVQNLRLFSRLDEAEFKNVNIHEGIESTLRLLSRYYSSGKITLRKEYGEVPLVNCYAGQLNQAWMNILVNAAQAMDAEGEVLIRTGSVGGQAWVSISDDGMGIPPESISKIFDPFFTTKPIGQGTGLGLSITYGIIERHGGSIEVQSRPGVGTTFRVMIPIDAPRGGRPEGDSALPDGVLDR